MLSREYKKAVLDSLDTMSTDDLVRLLKKIGSTPVLYNDEFTISPHQAYTIVSNNEDIMMNIEGDYVA